MLLGELLARYRFNFSNCISTLGELDNGNYNLHNLMTCIWWFHSKELIFFLPFFLGGAGKDSYLAPRPNSIDSISVKTKKRVNNLKWSPV